MLNKTCWSEMWCHGWGLNSLELLFCVIIPIISRKTWAYNHNLIWTFEHFVFHCHNLAAVTSRSNNRFFYSSVKTHISTLDLSPNVISQLSLCYKYLGLEREDRRVQKGALWGLNPSMLIKDGPSKLINPLSYLLYYYCCLKSLDI